MQKSPRLVLHAGPHKTATSYMQYNFHNSRAELQRRGWYYPKTGERVTTAHHDISDQRTTIENEKNRMVAELRGIGEYARAHGLDILLSSEGFQHWKPRHLLRLKELLQVNGLHVVYTIRDPLDLFYASWAQKVRNGMATSLPEQYAIHFADPQASLLLNPLVELGPTLRLAETTATVLLYDEIVARKLDIFNVFLERALKVSGIEPTALQIRNQRFPVEITEFLRAMTPLAKPSLDKTKIKIGAAVEHFLSEDFKTEIIETVRSKASEARQVIIVERAESGLIAIEELLIRRIGHLFYPEPSMPGRLFQGDQMEWVHYDAEALRQNPEVRALMDRALKRVGADSIHVRLANLAYGALIGFRQMRKRLGSMFSGHQS